MVDNERKPILVIGAGHQGLAMASHFSINGENVYLWNRSSENISEILETHSIVCEGIVEGTAYISGVSTNMEDVICDTIFVSTPSSAHRDIACKLADLLLPNSIVFLNPGRTFGAIDFIKTLKECGCRNIPIVVETQSIVYTCRRMGKNRAHIYALKKCVEMAYVGNVSREYILSKIPECIRSRFIFTDSVVDTSLGNVGMILHCAPVLLNAGWIESTKHAFYYYYDGISPSVGMLLDKMDAERVAVAKAIGARTFSLVEWFEFTYGVKGDCIYDCVQKNDYYREIDAPTSLTHRYLDEDVPNGLVPVEYLGKSLGIDVSTISLIIDLAIAIRGIDYRMIGRKFSADEIRKWIATSI